MGVDIEDAIRIDLKGDLDLGDATSSRRNAFKIKTSKLDIILGHRPFTLIDFNHHFVLVVIHGREFVRLLGRNDSVPLDDHSHGAVINRSTKG
mmetsp:Transcript_20546/g.40706  ORF Transcript_20546/g.40706 Transcript_20546/m.40706 type:complete len:93 (+) Transcript_20546:608-886(+)